MIKTLRTYSLYILILLLSGALWTTSCADDIIDTGGDNVPSDEKGIGQLVLFSSGSMENSGSSRAETAPYMELDGRFVCKMFYHAKAGDTDQSDFDTENTPITSWLKVNNSYGNSVYWNNQFNDISNSDKDTEVYKEYGFDPNAQFFYWRNRMDHIFLAYADYNKLKGNKYETALDAEGKEKVVSGSLYMYPESDDSLKTRLPDEIHWDASSYHVMKLVSVPTMVDNPDYLAYKEKQGDGPNPHPEKIHNGSSHLELSDVISTGNISYGSSNSMYSLNYSSAGSPVPVAKDAIVGAINSNETLSSEDKAKLLEDIGRTGPTDEFKESGGTYRETVWLIRYDDRLLVDGKINLLDENTIIYNVVQKKRVEEKYQITPANTFNLKRGTYTSMGQQPDPLIAYTKMKPLGATQEANRVRLYFKHQFSQIQVNLSSESSSTADIRSENIKKVELLGVTEKGYVFTTINSNGTQIASTYDPVVINKFTKEQIAKNPYGTSFEMFDMKEAKPTTSLKSFNAIAFGQLQAIRITWKENDSSQGAGVEHSATYKVSTDDRKQDLKNLRSGTRYVYDFELRRGTIAFMRANIVGWKLSDDLSYGTTGTITN